MIFVHPLDILEYYRRNEQRLAEYEHQLAESDDGVAIYLVSNDFPVVNVYIGDTLVSEHETDEDSLMSTYMEVLDEWGVDLTEIADEDEDDEMSEEDKRELIDLREDQLTGFAVSMIYDILEANDDDTVGDAEIEEAAVAVKELVCDLLAKGFGFEVYRPMFLISETGEKFFEEYPYPSMIESNKED